MIRLILLLSALFAIQAQAVTFDEYFTDSTLRIDYVLSGNVQHQQIHLDKLNRYPGWAGRRNHLAELPILGNGQLIMTDTLGQVLYKTSFSTLFQEWLCEEEARQVSRSFEHCMQVPFPKQKVHVRLQLCNNRHKTICELTHTIDPQDILIHRIGEKDLHPFKVLKRADNPLKAIHIAILAEGYQISEVETFYKDAQIAVDALFEHEPFKALQDRFSVVAVASPSKESGVSIPKKADWRQTAFGSHFSTFYSDRYLTSLNIKDIHNALAGIPYEHIIVLANTEEYGGGGIYNNYNLSAAHHPKFRPVVVHEFGHSFAGLADEYQYGTPDGEEGQYPLDVEPWEKNITTKVDPSKAKEIGNFEGGGYKSKGVFRFQDNCRMRTNEHPYFCAICQKAIREIIEFYTE